MMKRNGFMVGTGCLLFPGQGKVSPSKPSGLTRGARKAAKRKALGR